MHWADSERRYANPKIWQQVAAQGVWMISRHNRAVKKRRPAVNARSSNHTAMRVLTRAALCVSAVVLLVTAVTLCVTLFTLQ